MVSWAISLEGYFSSKPSHKNVIKPPSNCGWLFLVLYLGVSEMLAQKYTARMGF
jgi:hypothetical protein